VLSLQDTGFLANETMSEASARSSSNASPTDAQHKDSSGEVDRDPIVLAPMGPDGLVLLWHEDSGDVGSVLSDYE
jgi:hypothetical protein